MCPHVAKSKRQRSSSDSKVPNVSTVATFDRNACKFRFMRYLSTIAVLMRGAIKAGDFVKFLYAEGKIWSELPF